MVQVICIDLLTLGSLFYLLTAMPMLDKILNWIEIINEVAVLLLVVFLFGCSGDLLTPDQKYDLGWWACSVVILNILIHIAMLIIELIKDLVAWCKKKNKMKELNKQREIEKRMK